MKSVNVLLLVLFAGVLVVNACSADKKKEGVIEGYKPEKPIEFSHNIHAGLNAIDCKFCHTQPEEKVEKSVCMKCHKQIKGRTQE